MQRRAEDFVHRHAAPTDRSFTRATEPRPLWTPGTGSDYASSPRSQAWSKSVEILFNSEVRIAALFLISRFPTVKLSPVAIAIDNEPCFFQADICQASAKVKENR